MSDAIKRLRAWLRPIRRTTIVGPMIEAAHLRALLRHIRGSPMHVRVLGPDELAPYIRNLTLLSPDRAASDARPYDYVVIRQDHLGALDRRLLTALGTFGCVYANARFALFEAGATPVPSAATDDVRGRIATLTADAPPVPAPDRRAIRDRAILVTTFNRPAALQRTLPQLARFNMPVLVVDDGSSGPARGANRQTCETCGAAYLLVPETRGLAAAINMGLGYLMADPAFQWISYFQDDVDVRPDAMDQLRLLEDASQRPILTGYDADEHATTREEQIAGVAVKLKASSSAVHLHAHRAYWTAVLPIPSEYVAAPKRRWEASLEDYWIVNHAPESAGKRGLLIPCVPGLVRTFLYHHADSTWGNPNQPEPPLRTS
jgi:hypothetical protein